MKKRVVLKLSSAFLLILSLYMVSCKKDDISFGASANPTADLTTLSIFDLGNPLFFSNNNWTMGLVFKSSKNGRITHLGARLAKGTYTVALWDSLSMSVIASGSVTVTDSTQFAYVDISDVSVSANKSYVVSVNNTVGASFRDYWIYNFDGSGNYFPHTVGDITFIKAMEKNTTDGLSLFPTYSYDDYFIGIATVKFEPEI